MPSCVLCVCVCVRVCVYVCVWVCVRSSMAQRPRRSSSSLQEARNAIEELQRRPRARQAHWARSHPMERAKAARSPPSLGLEFKHGVLLGAAVTLVLVAVLLRWL